VPGAKRLRIIPSAGGEMLAANVAPFAEAGGDTAQGEMLARTILDRLQAYLTNVNFASEPYSRLSHIGEPGVLADVIPPLMPIEIGRRQELLDTGNATARLETMSARANRPPCPRRRHSVKGAATSEFYRARSPDRS
jgi:hypothetical protein